VRVPPLRKPTIQVALLLGCGLLVGLWVYTGYEFTVRMAAVEEQSAAITARYLGAQDTLTTIRQQLLVASVYVRDALLESNPALVERYRQQLETVYAAIDGALRSYEPVLGTEAERQQVERLRGEIAGFRQMTTQVLRSASRATQVDIRRLLNQNVVPRREAALRVSEEVQALNRSAFVQHQTDITRVHREAERRTWQQVGLALILSLGIGLCLSFYAGHLESRLVAQMQTNEQNARELQHLSTRLIGAQEEERRNIARELHDEVGQALTAVQVELSIAERRLRAAGQNPTVLSDAEAIAQRALTTVRDISHLLHPALLDDLGLVAAIDWQAKAFESRHAIRVDVRQEGITARLPRDVELAAYRIVQEALTNIAKHAGATSCQILLRQDDGDLEVTVSDDGRGFDPAEITARRGLGLAGIRERATLLSGRVALESERGAGTRVRVRLPVTTSTHA
jgi:signal transduction histidine kinase